MVADRDPYHPVWGRTRAGVFQESSGRELKVTTPPEIERGLDQSRKTPDLSCDISIWRMLVWGLWTAARYGGCRRPWGSTATVQIYRIVIVGVLCSQILLASLGRTPYEGNTFTSLKEVHYIYRSAYNLF